MTDTKQSGKDYLVTGVSVGYTDPNGAPGGFALRGNIVELDEKEAKRLEDLGVVREASKDEKERAGAVFGQSTVAHDPGPVENPYGGTHVVTPEDHAADLAAEATKKK